MDEGAEELAAVGEGGSGPDGQNRGFASFRILEPGGFAEAAALETGRAGLRRSVLVTDGTVRRLFGHLFPEGVPVLETGEGESAKTLAAAEALCAGFLRLGIDRQSLIVAVGGGVVCDVAAFAASIWMRGVRCGLFPTTLLAQADAGLGGKCGVNFLGQKNLLGTISPHAFCLCDPAFLGTLPRRELACGLAEIAKMACLYDEELFRFLEENASALLAGNPVPLAKAVRRSLTLKADIVSADPFERGLRRQLNFGHTFGHAIEAVSHLGHGASVAVGMRLSALWSLEKGCLSEGDFMRLNRLLDALELPGLSILTSLDVPAVCRGLCADKKRLGASIRFVALSGIGLGQDAVLTESVPIQALSKWLSDRT